jgi:hypothetical protein
MLSPKLAAELNLKWEAQKDKLRLKFPQITDDDLDFDQTKKQEMFTNLQLKLGRTARELQVIVDTL